VFLAILVGDVGSWMVVLGYGCCLLFFVLCWSFLCLLWVCCGVCDGSGCGVGVVLCWVVVGVNVCF